MVDRNRPHKPPPAIPNRIRTMLNNALAMAAMKREFVEMLPRRRWLYRMGGSNRYKPHQGKQECERRRRQMVAGIIQPYEEETHDTDTNGASSISE